MWLNYHHLYYFYRVAKIGHLTLAAKQLHISQSAVTIQLRQLSQHLKVRLFEKSGRRLVLTEEGRRVLEYAESIFKLGDELIGSLREGDVPRARQVQIGATGGLSKNFQLQLIEPMLKEPDFQIQVVVGDLEGLIARLQSFRLDLIISHLAPPTDTHRELRVSEIGRSPFVLARHRSLKPSANAQPTPLFVGVSGTGAHFQFIKNLDQALRMQGLIEDVALLRSIVLTRKSYVFVPKIALKPEIESGLVHIEREFRNFSEVFYSIERVGVKRMPIVNRVLENLGDTQFIR